MLHNNFMLNNLFPFDDIPRRVRINSILFHDKFFKNVPLSYQAARTQTDINVLFAKLDELYPDLTTKTSIRTLLANHLPKISTNKNDLEQCEHLCIILDYVRIADKKEQQEILNNLFRAMGKPTPEWLAALKKITAAILDPNQIEKNLIILTGKSHVVFIRKWITRHLPANQTSYALRSDLVRLIKLIPSTSQRKNLTAQIIVAMKRNDVASFANTISELFNTNKALVKADFIAYCPQKFKSNDTFNKKIEKHLEADNAQLLQHLPKLLQQIRFGANQPSVDYLVNYLADDVGGTQWCSPGFQNRVFTDLKRITGPASFDEVMMRYIIALLDEVLAEAAASAYKQGSAANNPFTGTHAQHDLYKVAAAMGCGVDIGFHDQYSSPVDPATFSALIQAIIDKGFTPQAIIEDFFKKGCSLTSYGYRGKLSGKGNSDSCGYSPAEAEILLDFFRKIFTDNTPKIYGDDTLSLKDCFIIEEPDWDREDEADFDMRSYIRDINFNYLASKVLQRFFENGWLDLRQYPERFNHPSDKDGTLLFLYNPQDPQTSIVTFVSGTKKAAYYGFFKPGSQLTYLGAMIDDSHIKKLIENRTVRGQIKLVDALALASLIGNRKHLFTPSLLNTFKTSLRRISDFKQFQDLPLDVFTIIMTAIGDQVTDIAYLAGDLHAASASNLPLTPEQRAVIMNIIINQFLQSRHFNGAGLVKIFSLTTAAEHKRMFADPKWITAIENMPQLSGSIIAKICCLLTGEAVHAFLGALAKNVNHNYESPNLLAEINTLLAEIPPNVIDYVCASYKPTLAKHLNTPEKFHVWQASFLGHKNSGTIINALIGTIAGTLIKEIQTENQYNEWIDGLDEQKQANILAIVSGNFAQDLKTWIDVFSRIRDMKPPFGHAFLSGILTCESAPVNKIDLTHADIIALLNFDETRCELFCDVLQPILVRYFDSLPKLYAFLNDPMLNQENVDLLVDTISDHLPKIILSLNDYSTLLLKPGLLPHILEQVMSESLIHLIHTTEDIIAALTAPLSEVPQVLNAVKNRLTVRLQKHPRTRLKNLVAELDISQTRQLCGLIDNATLKLVFNTVEDIIDFYSRAPSNTFELVFTCLQPQLMQQVLTKHDDHLLLLKRARHKNDRQMYTLLKSSLIFSDADELQAIITELDPSDAIDLVTNQTARVKACLSTFDDVYKLLLGIPADKRIYCCAALCAGGIKIQGAEEINQLLKIIPPIHYSDLFNILKSDRRFKRSPGITDTDITLFKGLDNQATANLMHLYCHEQYVTSHAEKQALMQHLDKAQQKALNNPDLLIPAYKAKHVTVEDRVNAFHAIYNKIAEKFSLVPVFLRTNFSKALLLRNLSAEKQWSRILKHAEHHPNSRTAEALEIVFVNEQLRPLDLQKKVDTFHQSYKTLREGSFWAPSGLRAKTNFTMFKSPAETNKLLKRKCKKKPDSREGMSYKMVGG